MSAIEKAITGIITTTLGIEHTEERGSDGLDFHDLHILRIKDALTDAYMAGAAKGLDAMGKARTVLSYSLCDTCRHAGKCPTRGEMTGADCCTGFEAAKINHLHKRL